MDEPTIAVPIHTDKHGVIRVSNTRVTLDVIVYRYLEGYSPESIHEGFPTVPVKDIYAIIAYYMTNQEELNAYLEHQEAELERIKKKIYSTHPPEITREILEARLKNRQTK